MSIYVWFATTLEMLPELLNVCQWRIFLLDVGVGVGAVAVAVGLGVGDGVGDAGETETASEIRQHSHDR